MYVYLHAVYTIMCVDQLGNILVSPSKLSSLPLHESCVRVAQFLISQTLGITPNILLHIVTIYQNPLVVSTNLQVV